MWRRNQNSADDGGGVNEEMDEFKHSKMLEKVIGGKPKAKNRSEATSKVSEFYIASVDSSTVNVSELLNSIKRSVKLATIGRHVDEKLSEDTTEVLPSPLSTEETKKIKREIAFGKVVKEVSRWEKLVLQNRQAEQLVFPLNQIRMKRENIQQLVSKHTSKTPLELEMESLLGKTVAPPPESNEKKKQMMSRVAFEEAMELRRTMSRIRARQSYYEEKARRAKKIKSKTYHRILKKDRLKAEVKSFDALSKSNPDLAEEKLRELEKKRILERMTLRHKNTGKWAKYVKMRAHHDKETSRALQDQIDIGSVLTQKKLVAAEDDDNPSATTNNDEADIWHPTGVFRGDASNPWMSVGANGAGSRSAESWNLEQEGEDVPEEGSIGYRQYWERENERRRTSGVKVPTADLDAIVLKRKLDPSDPSHQTEVVRAKSGKRKNREVTVSASDVRDAPTQKKREVSVSVDKTTTKKANKKREVNVSADNRKTKKANKIRAANQDGRDESFVKKSRNVPLDNDQDDVDRIFVDALKLKSTKDVSAPLSSPIKPKAKAARRAPPAEDIERRKEDRIVETLRGKNPTEARPQSSSSAPRKQENKKDDDDDEEDEAIDIDPNNFITVKTATVKLNVPDAVDYDDEAMDDNADDIEGGESLRMTLAEAFADDDVVEEFRIKKQEIVDKDLPKAVDNTLPGWGCWGGIGIKTPLSKRLRFTVPAGPAVKRADRKLGHVILHNDPNSKLQERQVSQVPHAFESKKDFQNFMKAPLGKDWNPVGAFQRHITPKIVTKKGAIIEPIDEEALEEHEFREKFRKDQEDLEEVYSD